MILRFVATGLVSILAGVLAGVAGFLAPFVLLVSYLLFCLVAAGEPQAMVAAVMAFFYLGIPAAIASGIVIGLVCGVTMCVVTGTAGTVISIASANA